LLLQLSCQALVFLGASFSAVFNYPQGDSNEPRKTQGNTGIAGQGGTDSGTLTDAGKVEALAAELMKLSPADRERLAAILRGHALSEPSGMPARAPEPAEGWERGPVADLDAIQGNVDAAKGYCVTENQYA
jgi:hypothetical protein